MPTLTLHRRYFFHGTFGELKDEAGELLAATIECPWQNNRPGLSCIPEGTYLIKRHQSPSKGLCLAIESPDLGVTLDGPSLRTHCLIHVANRVSELKGCIAPGDRFGVLDEDWAVLGSRHAMNHLLAVVGDQGAVLRIRGQ
ncbi:DUF5675 family protein [Gallaecimonas kandeliae]|nr:DUF5675 family protein [Gallaecimonas kandeliae]WKE67483.1 DUF5675 family protein [Gallaecimonas kandeliae]